MKILIVEDDSEIADFIAKGFEQDGHLVSRADNGKDGFLLALDGDFDVMVVDRMLPGLDGTSLVRAVRGAGNKTPILFLSALDGVNDRVEGLQAGADDYLVKPFAFSELSARIAALLRRPPLQSEQTKMVVGDLEVDLIRHRVTREGRLINLQPKEFRLLEYFIRNSGRVLTRTMLLEDVWDFHFDPHTNVVETHISRLRNKVDKPFDKPLIHTVRGAGYSLHA